MAKAEGKSRQHAQLLVLLYKAIKTLLYQVLVQMEGETGVIKRLQCKTDISLQSDLFSLKTYKDQQTEN